MKRREVKTAVTHPKAVEVMEEINGKPVRQAFQHELCTMPSRQTYEVIFTKVEV